MSASFKEVVLLPSMDTGLRILDVIGLLRILDVIGLYW